MNRRTLLALLLLTLVVPTDAAPKPKYLIWAYNDSPHITYVLRNWRFARRESVYYAEFTARNEVTGAVLGQEAFYEPGYYPWLPNQWPSGGWSNVPSRFLVVPTSAAGAGVVVDETNVLPEWAVGLPDFYGDE